MIRHSATLAVNERMQARRAAGERVLHLGFGEAGLPVLPSIAEVLADSVRRNEYGPVVGSTAARAAAAGYFTRRGLPTDPTQVIFAPGSKALLFALLAVLPGDLVLPQPSWVSYAAQAQLVGKRVIGVPIPAEAGGVPDPELLDAAMAASGRPGTLILTTPDNPTGTVASDTLVKQVCRIADRHGFTVISDEIYRDLGHGVVSPATYLPERTIVTSGLSKSLALGGYRIGFARLPAESLMAEVIGVASEVWSSMPSPMQAVAAHVLAEPEDVVAHVAASFRLHQTVSLAAHAEFVAAGAICRRPRGAFYLYPDFEPLRHVLGVDTGAELTELLLARHGVGVLAGVEFGDTPTGLRFRVATSLLYGDTEEQRWTALRSADPVALPWIADSLAHLRAAVQVCASTA